MHDGNYFSTNSYFIQQCKMFINIFAIFLAIPSLTPIFKINYKPHFCLCFTELCRNDYLLYFFKRTTETQIPE